MSLKTMLAILAVALFGFACTDTEHYPVSGEECAPDDPVQTVTDQQCAPV